MLKCDKNKNTCEIILFVLAGIIAVSFLAILIYKSGVNNSFSSESEQVVFEVKKGDSLGEVGGRLEKKDLVGSSFLLEFHGWFTGKGKKLKAGKYGLSPDMTIVEIVNKLARGKVMVEVDTIKIIEGWNLKEIANYLEKKGVAEKKDLFKVTGYPQGIYGEAQQSALPHLPEEYEFLQSKPSQHSLEGYLFPDTYQIYQDAEEEEIVNKMLKNFDDRVTEEMIRDAREKGRDLHQIVTMASLLAEEVKTKKEMKIVSGIFWDRISNRIPLQSCATLAYVLGENKTVYTGEDTQVESPYNTYKYKGLPPAPVSNPGIKAIKAAIYPIESDYQYFLSPVGSDKTLFSETLQEHQRKKQKYID